MKLTKENVYIDLRGKSNEDRIEILNYLKSIKEETEVLIHKEIHRQNTLEFYNEEWFTDESVWGKTEVTIEQLKEILEPIETETLQENVDLMGYSVLVDNEEQARKLQEIAFEQGFKWEYSGEKIKHLGEESFQFGYNGKKIITYNYGGNHYQDDFITKTAHFNDLFKAETLQEKANRLENELEEVKQQIKEDGKIKIGDICKFWDDDKSRFVVGKLEGVTGSYPYYVHGIAFKNCEKITDSTILESFNRLFKN